MTSRLLDILPLPQRLALAYAPPASKLRLLAFFGLDARLAQAVRLASEPIAGQMRLAWWRDQLGRSPEQRARSDDCIVALDHLAGIEQQLLQLVDGWERLLDEALDRDAVDAFASARAEALVGLAELLGSPDKPGDVRQCARVWALADLASGLSNSEERKFVKEVADEMSSAPLALSRALRPIFVLYRLSKISISNQTFRIISGPSSVYYSIRFGLFGR